MRSVKCEAFDLESARFTLIYTLFREKQALPKALTYRRIRPINVIAKIYVSQLGL